MNEAQAWEFLKANLLYILLAYAVIGFILGLIPFLLGRRRGKSRLGLIGLIMSVVLGLLSPVISIIVVVAFTIILIRGTKEPTTDDAPD